MNSSPSSLHHHHARRWLSDKWTRPEIDGNPVPTVVEGSTNVTKDGAPIQEDPKVAEEYNQALLSLVGMTTLGASLIMSPKAIELMKQSNIQYNELDVEDDMYYRMKEVSAEVRGEITKRVLGKDIDEMVEDQKKAAGNTADVVADVLNSEALQNAIVSLITRVIGSAQFQSVCQTLLKNLWNDLVTDPETLAQVVALLNTAIKDENIKRSFKELVLGLLQDEDVYDELTGLVVKLGEDTQVRDTEAWRFLNSHRCIEYLGITALFKI